MTTTTTTTNHWRSDDSTDNQDVRAVAGVVPHAGVLQEQAHIDLASKRLGPAERAPQIEQVTPDS